MREIRCRDAFRRGSDGQVHCRSLEGKTWDYCGNVYFCRVSRRWELTPEAERCPLRRRAEHEKGQNK